MGLESLDKAFKNTEKTSFVPSEPQMVYHMFYEKGISMSEFTSLPIPYIIGIVATSNYVAEENEKQIKKEREKSK